MTTKLSLISRTEIREICSTPEIGQLLGNYFVELLDESAAEEVEDHLLECGYCRNRYLRMLGLMDAALVYSEQGPNPATAEPSVSPSGADQVELTFVTMSKWTFQDGDDPERQLDSKQATPD